MDKRWHDFFFDIAHRCAQMSRDPSTKVGAVIVRPDKTVASVGFNGFPRYTRDSPELYADRDEKLRRVVHAEINAILAAREPLAGYTIYVTPFHPCPQCAGAIIQSGLKRVVFRGPSLFPERWEAAMETAAEMLVHAGIIVDRMGEANG